MCSGRGLHWLDKQGGYCSYHMALTAPLSREMLPGHLLMPGALQVLRTDREKCLPGAARSLREGRNVVATDFPLESTECQALPSFHSKTALSCLCPWPGPLLSTAWRPGCPSPPLLPLPPTLHGWVSGWEEKPRRLTHEKGAGWVKLGTFSKKGSSTSLRAARPESQAQHLPKSMVVPENQLCLLLPASAGCSCPWLAVAASSPPSVSPLSSESPICLPSWCHDSNSRVVNEVPAPCAATPPITPPPWRSFPGGEGEEGALYLCLHLPPHTPLPQPSGQVPLPISSSSIQPRGNSTLGSSHVA